MPRYSPCVTTPLTIQAPRIGGTCALAVLLFAAIAASLQFLRTDLDWYRTPLSFYLVGPHGVWLQAAYLLLSGALILLGLGYYQVLAVGARSAAPALLFAMAGIALAVTALAETAQRGRPPSLEAVVHGVAAQASLLCLTTGMLLQSWRMRLDDAWRHRFAASFCLALLCFAGMWVHVLWRGSPRGFGQKLLIVAILAWLLTASLWLLGSKRRAWPRRPATRSAS